MQAQAYEIVQGALVRFSAHSGGKAAPPTAVLVHGILGRRQNMLSFARRLVEGFPQGQVRSGVVVAGGAGGRGASSEACCCSGGKATL